MTLGHGRPQVAVRLAEVMGRASSKQLALISAILASTIAAVDSSAVNVALPAIGRDLGGGFAAQQWVANAYLLTLSALILLAGSLTDRLGERRVFMAGVGGFGIGSAAVRAVADDRRADRRAGPAGRLGRDADPGGAGDHRLGLPQGRARRRDRQVDRLGRDRDPRRPGARRRDRRRRVVAVDLPDQRADRDRRRRDRPGRGFRPTPPGRPGPQTARIRSRSTGPVRRWPRAVWPGSRSR